MGQLFGSSKESEDKENKQVECKPLRRRRVSPLVLKRVRSVGVCVCLFIKFCTHENALYIHTS